MKSIPRILFVQRHMILLTERAHLLLKVTLRVVRLLCVDILHQRAEVRRAYGEQTITPLPREGRCSLRLHPRRGGRLELRNGLGRCSGRSEAQRKMHMIRNAPCPEAFAVEPAGGPGKVCVQRRRKVIANYRHPALCTENDVDQIEIERLRHSTTHVSGLQPSLHHAERLLGLRPRLLCERAYGPDCVLQNQHPHFNHLLLVRGRIRRVEVHP